MPASTILAWQASAGNTAVQRALSATAVPADAPGLRAVVGQVAAAGKAFTRHPAGAREAQAAHDAARPPPDAKLAQAGETQAKTMASAKPASFDKAAFVEAVTAHVAYNAPKSGTDADAMAASGSAVTMPPAVLDEVRKSTATSVKPLAEATTASPDTAKVVDKPVRDLAPAPATPQPAIDTGKVAPPPVPAERTDLSAGPRTIEQQMAEHDLTDEQLAVANEPQFTQALAAKQALVDHAVSKPPQVRGLEAEHRAAARDAARSSTQQAVDAMGARTTRGRAGAKAHQNTARARDEAARAAVSAHVNDAFGRARGDVTKILDGLADTVPKMFSGLETIARLSFTLEYRGRLEAYKDERHSGWFGWARAIGDAVTGLPDEVNKIYDTAKARYVQSLRKAISDIADFVGRELTRAKQRVEDGRAEIATYVSSLSPKLREVGAEAALDIDAQFEELDASVDATATDLAETLAEQYAECTTAVNDEIAQSKTDEQGLIDDAKDFLSGVWNTVAGLKDLLLKVLKGFASAVVDIVRHPIRFFGNFVRSVGAGVAAFLSDLPRELLDGLKTWLFGSVIKDVELPDTLDAPNLIKLALDLLGLGWDKVKEQIAQAVPEPVREAAVQSVGALAAGGPAALIALLLDQLGGVVDAVKDKIFDYVRSTIIKAGMDKVTAIFGGAVGAFIEACKMIYHAFQWLAENLGRLGQLVDTVFSTVAELAESETEGVLAGVVTKVKTGLTNAIPILISGLASLLGLGDIAARVRSMLEAIKRPVKALLDKIVRGAARFGKGLMRKLAGSRLGRAGAALRGKVVDTIAAARRMLNLRLGRKIPVTMKGATHHIYTRVRGRAATLVIESTPDAVLGRIDRALTNSTVKANRDLVTSLTKCSRDIELYQDAVRTAQGIGKKETANAEYVLGNEARKIAKKLDRIGAKYDIVELQGSPWTTPEGMLLPRFRTEVRRLFYRYGYRDHTGRLLTMAHDEKRRRAVEFGANPMFARASYVCPGHGDDPAHLAYDVDGVQADHRKPVTTHWEETGRRTTQAKREEWDTDITNLVAMCPYHNRKKGSGGEHFTPQTEKGFDGPL